MDAIQSRNTSQELAVLQRINQTLCGTLDLDEVLRRIITELVALLAAQSASVILHDERRQEAELTTTYGSAPIFHTLRYPLAGSLTGWVAEHRRTLRVARLTPEEWPLVWQLAGQLHTTPAPVAVLLVPLWVQRQVVGSLEVVWEAGHPITAHEEQLLEAVAVQAALAITNARLYQEKERALQEARLRAEALQESETRFRRLVDSNIIGFIVTAGPHQIIDANDAFLDMLGYTRAELEAGLLQWPALTPPEYHPLDERGIAELMASGQCKPFEKEYLRKDGTRVPILIGAARFAQDPLQWICFILDLSERRRSEDALRHAKEAAEAASRTKSEFLATMSHELRTPLGIILGYTSLLLEDVFGRLQEEQGDTLRRIERNARELLDLITAVLDLSRLEAGRLPVKTTEVEVAQLLEEIRTETLGVQERTHLAFLWRVEGAVPSLWTDAGKLKIVVKNLIGNAAKFTPAGSVTVAAREQQGGIEFCVTDTGVGLPPEVFALIFEPFQQVETAQTPQQGGTGLGLHIVKRLVELLGGRVRVESEVGRGSTFRVWVPCGRPEDGRAA